MKCCAIFVMVLLVVLVADASAAPPRSRHLMQRRSHRVRLVPKYALRRSSHVNPDCDPASEHVAVVADEPHNGSIEVAAPLISDDPAINELDAPVAAIEHFPPETPSEESAAEEADDEQDEHVPATKDNKHPTQAWPHIYFPMKFGRTSGGSIAVANSFSTGKGNAVSHAIAYGGGKSNREV